MQVVSDNNEGIIVASFLVEDNTQATITAGLRIFREVASEVMASAASVLTADLEYSPSFVMTDDWYVPSSQSKSRTYIYRT